MRSGVAVNRNEGALTACGIRYGFIHVCSYVGYDYTLNLQLYNTHALNPQKENEYDAAAAFGLGSSHYRP